MRLVAETAGPEDDWFWDGDPSPDLLACGHSHCGSLRLAMRQGLIDPSMRVAVLSQRNGLYHEPNDAYWKKVRAASKPIAVVWSGNEHNQFLLGAQFRLAYGDERQDPEDGSDRPLTPVSAIRALFQPALAGLDTLLKRIASSAIVVGTPPPKPEPLIRAGLAREPKLIEKAGKLGLDIHNVPISPLSLRVKLWAIYQDLLGEYAARHGAAFAPVPGTAMEADGSLRAELSAPDATHANPAFGALMWCEIFSRAITPAP